MPPHPSLDHLDLSKLDEQERTILERHHGRSNLGWYAAILCCLLTGMALFLLIRSGSFGVEGSYTLIIKLLGYLAFGLWARSSSKLGTVLLLAWHILTSHQYIDAATLQLKLHFWVPALGFTMGCLQAFVLSGIIKKAQPDNPAAEGAGSSKDIS